VRFVTFLANGEERFGIVLIHPTTGDEWVFDPEMVENLLKLYASAPTSPYVASKPRFLESRPWPRDMVSFLALGEVGMSAARRLQDFLLRFLEQSDPCLLAGAGYPLAEVKLRAPIPRPRLYFGLVSNSATHWRNDPARVILNIYPQGHARPQGTVLGPGDPVVVPGPLPFGWNPELGVIIGRGGKDIEVSRAREHIAGLTVVLDMTSLYYRRRFGEEAPDLDDWFVDATGDWLGKMTDTFCPMGPYLTTLDEVGNPYDLLVYTRQSGWLRDRSHTNSMLIGIERLISWLSSFITLRPGDVLHLGTAGYDGMRMTSEMPLGPEDYLEGEIERVGVLRAPVVRMSEGDWRSPDDVGRTMHPSPAVRDVITSGTTIIEGPDAWSLEKVRHFWTVYGNYKAAPEAEGLVQCHLPRVLNGPARALTTSGDPIRITRRARTLSIGPELAFVIGRLAYRVPEEEAEAYILGYMTMASIFDSSFSETIREPATPQERNTPGVYGRWADGFNVISMPPVPLPLEEIRGRQMSLSVDGCGTVSGNTDEYVLLAPRILAFLSAQITLFPGDVVTLGRVANLLIVPHERRLPRGTMLHATIEGLGEILSPIIDERV